MLKDIANKAEACRMYAKKAGMDLKGQNILAEGRIRAERKAGKNTGKNTEKNPEKSRRSEL